jgi:hypothetical protein
LLETFFRDDTLPAQAPRGRSKAPSQQPRLFTQRFRTTVAELIGASDKAIEDIDKVRAALSDRRINAPSSFEVKLDGRNHHHYKSVP